MDSKLKVSRAKIKLNSTHPFFGSLALFVGTEEDNSMPTMFTNGKMIGWNNEFVQGLTEDETRGILAHEILHIVFQHCEPHLGKDPLMCNVAMDFVINWTLKEDGFVLPDSALYDPTFANMTWQKVYDIINDCQDKQKQNEGGEEPDYTQGAAGKEGLSEEKQKELGDLMKQVDPDIMDVIENSDLTEEEKQDLKQKIVQAAQNQKASGIGKLPGALEGLINEIRTPKVDWKSFLYNAVKSLYPEDYTWARPNKRFMGAYNVYLPTMYGERAGAIAIGLDTSGSVSMDEITEFLAEINFISNEIKPENVYLFYCDCDVAHMETYDADEEIDTLNPRGGGGTSFVPVFETIEKEDIEIDQLIYFSDMEV